MPNFKNDVSFLEKISIGAIGTKRVFQNLLEQGHVPIELERGSMSYKIWRGIKIKRIRVPDILLVDCGVRIESRAKTKFQITMSHSQSDPERGWDHGLNNTDYIAIVGCSKIGTKPTDWEADKLVQYFAVKDLRNAVTKGETIETAPKGSQEGFERRLVWPACIASSNGTITKINSNSLQFKKDNNTIVTLQLNNKGIQKTPCVQVNEKIIKNQILAATVPVTKKISMQEIDYSFYINGLSSSLLSDRYTAAKALKFFNNDNVKSALLKRLEDSNEHIYIKLESAASLIKLNYESGYSFLEETLRDNYLQNVLETVIVLSELHTQKASQILTEILINKENNPEIRAAAAWGLGELKNEQSIEVLSNSFFAIEENIRVEAARALSKFVDDFTAQIVEKFKLASQTEKPGLAWVLTKSNTISLTQLIEALSDRSSREWIAYIIGIHGEKKFLKHIEDLKQIDPEVYFAATVLWKIMASWIYNLEEY